MTIDFNVLEGAAELWPLDICLGGGHVYEVSGVLVISILLGDVYTLSKKERVLNNLCDCWYSTQGCI
jgi:hypothetical protein